MNTFPSSLRLSIAVLAALAALAQAPSVLAQQPAPASSPQPKNDDSKYLTLPLWPGVPAGSESATWTESQRVTRGGGRFIYNVTKPSILVMPADPKVANGTAVVVVPGGGFRQLNWDGAGVNIAKQLNQIGITAIVLKYRLNHNDVSAPQGEPSETAGGRGGAAAPANPPPPTGTQRTGARALAIEDARQAMKLIRQHASEWKIDPNRVGWVGFSAGGMLGLDLTLTSDPSVRPNFLAVVYGTIGDFPAVTPDAPPLFLATSVPDNTGAGRGGAKMAMAWIDAGRSVELHLYAKGAHGFATLGEPGEGETIPAHSWMDRFQAWLDNEGWLRPPAGRP